MEKYNRTIPANSSIVLNAEGYIVYCENADDVFYINAPGNKTYEMKAKRRYTLKEGLRNFELENRTASPISIELHIGNDDLEDNSVNLAGTVTIAHDVPVKNAAGTTLKVDDDEAQLALAAISAAVGNAEGKIDALIALMQNDVALRKPVTTLENCSYAGITNASTEILSAAANVNGIIIRAATIATSGNTATLSSDGEVIARVMGASGTAQALFVENIFIPAGRNLLANTGSTSSVYIWYEVL
jgi:hypothetical protein